jgi:hypothetical protein
MWEAVRRLVVENETLRADLVHSTRRCAELETRLAVAESRG